MATNIGAKVELAGEREFRQALSQINTSLKTTASELKLVTARYSENADSVAGLTAKNEALQKKLDQQREKVETLRKALENAKVQYGETDTKTLKWQQSLNLAEAELIQVEKELKDNSAALQEAQKNMEKYGLSTDEVAESNRSLGEIIVDLADKVGIRLPSNISKSISSFGQQMSAAEKAKVELAALTTVVIGLATAFGKATIETSKKADEILTLASTTGLATEKIQELRYAEELLDVSTETITGSMTRMIRNMNTARNGTGEAAEAFRKLRIRITDSNGQLKDAEEIFNQTIDALGRVGNETERDALAMAIFGRSARELNPLIEAGSKALNELAQEAHEMGYVMDQETLESFGALDDAMQRFNKQSETFKQSIGMVLLPVLTSFFELLNKIDPQVLAVGATLAATVITVITAVKAVKNITDTFKAFDAQTWKTTAIVLGVTAALIALVAIIGVLAGKGKEMEQTMAGIGESVGKMTNIVNNAPNQLQQRIGRNALGTSNWRGGLTWVGEEGPELLDVPAGSRIIDNRRSMQLVRQSANGGDVYIGNVTMNVNADDFKKVGDFINLFEQFRQVKRAGMVMK
jgi:methyl-accepting chemotaxis protein